MGLQPVQAQGFTLYGNGCLIGDTTLILASFNDINGTALTMTSFGSIGTGTVEPGSGTNEEQIIFTGVTTNANGSITLTGISSVGFEYPYTLTTGFAKSHFGGTSFVLSDTAYLYTQYANLNGTSAFSISPTVPTPTSATQVANKAYVDGVAIAGAPKAGTTTFGIVELSVNPVTGSVPIAVGDNDPRVGYVNGSQSAALAGNGGIPSGTNTYVTQVGLQNGTETFAVATGSSTAYAVSYNPAHTSYVKGQLFRWQANVASGTSPTLNADSLGAKNLFKQTVSGTTALVPGDLGTNQMVIGEYDGGAIQLVSPTLIGPTQSLQTAVTTVGLSSGSPNSVTNFTTTFKPSTFIVNSILVGENAAGAQVNSYGISTFSGSTWAGFNFVNNATATTITTPVFLNAAPFVGANSGTGVLVTLTITNITSTGFSVTLTGNFNASPGTINESFSVTAIQ